MFHISPVGLKVSFGAEAFMSLSKLMLPEDQADNTTGFASSVNSMMLTESDNIMSEEKLLTSCISTSLHSLNTDALLDYTDTGVNSRLEYEYTFVFVHCVSKALKSVESLSYHSN